MQTSLLATPFKLKISKESLETTRKQLVLGPLFFSMFFYFSKPIVDRFAFLSQTTCSIEIQSWKAIFLALFLLIVNFFSSGKACVPLFLSSGNPPSPCKTTLGRKGTAHKENPGPQPLPGKIHRSADVGNCQIEKPTQNSN